METIEYKKPDISLYNAEFRAALLSAEFQGDKSPCTFLVGKDKDGNIHTADLKELNNLLIIGSLGTGKTSFIDSCLLSVINKASPNDLKLIIISAKPNELNCYNSLPHLLCPVITDRRNARRAVCWLHRETTARTKKLTETGARSFDGYNRRQEKPEYKLPRIVLVVDGIDILRLASDGQDDYFYELLMAGNNTGIHVVATVTHLAYITFSSKCQSCMPNRISFRTVTSRQSLAGVGIHGAEKLGGLGRILFSTVSMEKPIELQIFYLEPDEVESVLDSFESRCYYKDVYDKLFVDYVSQYNHNGKQEDELLPDAVRLVIESGAAGISMIQRRLRVGYARAARLIEIMEQKGYVSETDDSKPRKVLLDADGYNDSFGGEIASSRIAVDYGYYDDDENDCADYENDDYDDVDDEEEYEDADNCIDAVNNEPEGTTGRSFFKRLMLRLSHQHRQSK